VAGAFLLLLAVQYAAIGVAPGCADGYSHAARAVAQAAAPHGHTTHGLGSPCAPAHQDSAPHHSPAGCLAMTGCATAGIAAVATPQLITPECTAERTSLSRALFVSVLPTPETPPPIA
jgi:hypothetical protein